MRSLAFRPLAREDLPQLFDWVHREHVKRWWRPEDDFDEFAADYLAALAGRDASDHFVIELDGRPVGAIQTYLVHDHPDWEALVRVGPDVAGIDLFIGEESEIGRGLGPEILREFLRDVVFARSATRACVAGVEPGNRRSLRAFEKAGFRAVRDYVEEGRPRRLLRAERDETVARADSAKRE